MNECATAAAARRIAALIVTSEQKKRLLILIWNTAPDDWREHELSRRVSVIR
jgi:hypothetical protein